MNCLPFLTNYLNTHCEQWVPTPLLYTLGYGKSFTYGQIKGALATIAATPPYAYWSVQQDDYHAHKQPGVDGRGVYYRRQPMRPNEIRDARNAIAYFDALP